VATWPVYGLAAATQVACGAVRIPLPRFAAALVAMAMLWAGLQTAVGVAVLVALATRATPWMVVLLAALVVVRVALSARRRRADAISAPSHG
jgi:membrane protein DedA with SNARE-associated domain